MRIFALPLLLACSCGSAWAETPRSSQAPPVPVAITATAESVYNVARPKLLQIRTLVGGTGRQSSIGSGFVVTADGLAVTNYHVVSQYALEPATYRMEYAAPDGSVGSIQLVAIDVINDLAVVRLQSSGLPFFQFNPRSLEGSLPKGERIYSMGNPLDLGFTIVEGTYNGFVERSYNERIHFSGSLNPGMSGGPAVTVDGRVVGINVAKRLSGEQVSFLVPARFAAAMLEKAREGEALEPETARKEISRQLGAWQSGLYRAMSEQGLRRSTLGPYLAPESAAPWFTCWSRTNAAEIPKPRALVNSTDCNTETSLFVSGDVVTGSVSFKNSHVQAVDLNAFQFANYLSAHSRLGRAGRSGGKRHTSERCHEGFVTNGGGDEGAERPVVRAVWCARAYREFDDLYDVSVTLVTQDRDKEALVSRLGMTGVSYENALALGKSFLGAVEWAK